MKKVCIFCAETVKTCAAASEYIFYASANVWLLLLVFQCFLTDGRLLLKGTNERLLLKENMQLLLNIFFYVQDCIAASRNISMFLMNGQLILRDLNERLLLKEKKNVFLRIMFLKKYFEF